jgi:hypothetical protein
MEQGIDVDVVFDDEDSADVVALLNEVGATNVKDDAPHAFTGAEILIVGIVLAQALVTLVTRIARIWKCGVILDARTSPVTVQKNCDVPRGTMVIVKGDGSEVTLDKPSEEDVTAILKGWLPGRA